MNHRRTRPRRKRFPDRWSWDGLKLKPGDMPEAQPRAILDDWQDDVNQDRQADDERYESEGRLPPRIEAALNSGDPTDVATVREYIGA